MVNAYFVDTSALVKRYVPEIGSDWILSITDPATNSDLVISQITWVEVHSAFARRLRDGSLSAERFDLIVQKVREDFENEYRVVDVDRTLIETAAELVMQHPLRAYDAVQLASALRVQSHIPHPNCHMGCGWTESTPTMVITARYIQYKCLKKWHSRHE
ncbi:type II toxin-antitoxin system VapC family toxin, partial [Tychonema sp. LEGE 07203]|uniref:type II toxin-antitoxin system VapC family toxin n=1 Tax=Tychonema sp. LEGE 07203 TaxID=1828671 RepID=UPI00187FBC0D|nr:type II toxin-antitoxin system VapC family toxin [Tychonema sp. LEGE 07203]